MFWAEQTARAKALRWEHGNVPVIFWSKQQRPLWLELSEQDRGGQRGKALGRILEAIVRTSGFILSITVISVFEQRIAVIIDAP